MKPADFGVSSFLSGKRGIVFKCMAVLVAVVVVIILFASIAGNRKYVVNKEESFKKGNQTVTEGCRIYSSESEEISFEYPEGCKTAHDEENGTYIYLSESKQEPYVLVYCTNEKSTSPEKYFAGYKKAVKAAYENDDDSIRVSSFSDISKVKVGDKTLYMVRADFSKEGSTFVIERFIELYENRYIQYTVKSYHIEDDEPVLYNIIDSLRLSAGAYQNAQQSPEAAAEDGSETEDAHLYDTAVFKNDTVGISMSVPVDIEASEIPVGIIAKSDDIMLFASYQNTDADGAAIYNTDDFISRCSAVSDLLDRQIGTDSIDVGNGKTAELNGQDAYVFDMTMVSGDFSGSGKLYMISGANTGCYLVYYAVADSVKATDEAEKNAEKIESVAALCASSFAITQDPQNVRKFDTFTYGTEGFSVLCERGLFTGEDMTDTGKGISFDTSSIDKNSALVIDGTSFEKLGGITSAEEILSMTAKEYEGHEFEDGSTFEISDIQPVAGGRFEAFAENMTFNADGKKQILSMTAFSDQKGNIWFVRFMSSEDNLDKFTQIRDDIVWSFKLN